MLKNQAISLTWHFCRHILLPPLHPPPPILCLDHYHAWLDVTRWTRAGRKYLCEVYACPLGSLCVCRAYYLLLVSRLNYIQLKIRILPYLGLWLGLSVGEEAFSMATGEVFLSNNILLPLIVQCRYFISPIDIFCCQLLSGCKCCGLYGILGRSAQWINTQCHSPWHHPVWILQSILT